MTEQEVGVLIVLAVGLAFVLAIGALVWYQDTKLRRRHAH